LIDGSVAPRLIFLNRFFYPDHSATSQMLSDLAFALAEQGQQVAVITSRQRYDTPAVRLPAQEKVNGVEIFRLWTSHFGRHNLAGRAIDYLTFYIFAAWRLWRLARAGDVVIAKTDPPMLSLIAAPIARLRGAKLVNWLQDVFPEVAEAVTSQGRTVLAPTFGVLRWLRNRSLELATVNVAVGERMAQRLIDLGLPREGVHVLPNWADGTLVRPIDHGRNYLREAWDLDGKFVIGYSGNLGRAHEYATLLAAIEHIERLTGHLSDNCAPIVWLFIGGGALYEQFKVEVERRKLSSVSFKPYQPREQLGAALSAVDVHLVCLRPELEGLIVPSKFYGIAAAGRPAIFIGAGNGEIAQLIARYGCGCTVEEGDGAGLVRTLLDLVANQSLCRDMGKRARRAFDVEFDKRVAVSRWQALLTGVAAVSPVCALLDGPLAPSSSKRPIGLGETVARAAPSTRASRGG
jgi:glycosyltransferase involved in cell wall biosynthesis